VLHRALVYRQPLPRSPRKIGVTTRRPVTSTLEEAAAEPSPAGQVVLDYCAAVRGILNDDQGGPLHPPGLRMADALEEVRQSLDRCLAAKKGGPQKNCCKRLAGSIDRGLDLVKDTQAKVRQDVEKIQAPVADTLDPAHGSLEERRDAFEQLQQRFSQQKDPLALHLVKLMISFVAGLFVGPVVDFPEDNLDLERGGFRKPKSHERRDSHGRCHAGVRLVQEGPTLVLTLDAHSHHPEPFVAEDLIPYRSAQPPPSQTGGDCIPSHHAKSPLIKKATCPPGRIGAALSASPLDNMAGG